MKKEMYNILFCGIGGQGVLKASEICGVAAMKSDYHVKKSEVKGMSQRGGSVESHVRMGEKVYSPLIPRGEADIVVCFDKSEGERMQHFLKKNGVSFLPYLADAENQLDDKRFLNTYLLGVLSAHLPIDQQTWLDALQEIIPYKIEQNKEIFIKGSQIKQ